MADVWANNLSTKLTAALSTSETSMTVASLGDLTLAAGQTARVTIQNGDASSYEIVIVTAISNKTLTITRAQEGTTAQAWAIDDVVVGGITKVQLGGFVTNTSVIAIAQGGTGANTAAAARTALGLGAVATMGNIPIANGGTGANTAPNARVALGLGTAATANVTTSSKDTTRGAVMRQGDWGVARQVDEALPTENLPLSTGLFPNCAFFRVQGGDTTGHGTGVGQAVGLQAGTYLMQYLTLGNTTNAHAMIFPVNVRHEMYHGTLSLNNGSTTVKRFFKFYDDANTMVDANGFIKVASPIVRLFSDRIELNEEAALQDIAFERVDIGHYLLKGTSGFATEGWWFNVPVDANGNKIVASTHKTLDDGTLEIKTFKRKFDIETATIVPDLGQPIDIPANSIGEQRWIDIRIVELPVEIPEEIE